MNSEEQFDQLFQDAAAEVTTEASSALNETWTAVDLQLKRQRFWKFSLYRFNAFYAGMILFTALASGALFGYEFLAKDTYEIQVQSGQSFPIEPLVIYTQESAPTNLQAEEQTTPVPEERVNTTPNTLETLRVEPSIVEFSRPEKVPQTTPSSMQFPEDRSAVVLEDSVYSPHKVDSIRRIIYVKQPVILMDTVTKKVKHKRNKK